MVRRLVMSAALFTGVGWTIYAFFVVSFVGGWKSTSAVGMARTGLLLTLIFGLPVCVVVGAWLGLMRKAPTVAFFTSALGALGVTLVVAVTLYSYGERNSASLPVGFLMPALLVVTMMLCNVSSIWLLNDWLGR